MFENSPCLRGFGTLRQALSITVNVAKIIAYFLPVFGLVYIYKYGVTVIQQDEFTFVDMFNDKVDFWNYILKPHNEHIMPLGKLEYYLVAWPTDMNSQALMYANIFTLWIAYFFMVRKIETKNLFAVISCITVIYLSFFSLRRAVAIYCGDFSYFS